MLRSMRKKFLVVGVVAVAIGAGATAWYAAAPDDVTVTNAPGSDWSGWTGYAAEDELQAARFDARRREGLEAILSGMRANGATPEQIDSVEAKLDKLDG